jgi:hypothetical protein
MRTVSQASVGCVEAPDGLLTAAQPGRHGLWDPGADPGPRRSLVMSGSSAGDSEGGEGPGRVAGVVT